MNVCCVPDIPYHVSEEDGDRDADSLQYVDAGTVVVASTSRTARYWETHQVAPHDNAAAASVMIRTSAMWFCLGPLLVINSKLVLSVIS